MSKITKNLAKWIVELKRDDIPEHVITTVRMLAMDTFACALIGRSQPWARVIETWALAAKPASGQLAGIWGQSGLGVRAADAALVNGCAAHAFELDDFHNAKVHLGAVIVPAVFALAETLNSNARQIEKAMVIGYEVIIRTSLALKPAEARLRGWHLTAVCGPLGAAAAASVLLGLNEERTQWALGLAGTQSGGLFAFTADGTDSKRFHPGRASQAGVMAAELAALGLSGPTQIYEVKDGGFLSAFADKPDGSLILDGLGERWRAPETNFKPYACCGSVHAHVDAALQLRSHWTTGTSVRVGMPKVVKIQCGYDYVPGSSLNAQMSARYSIAAALIDGAVLTEQFEDERMQSADIVQLANSIVLVHDEALDELYPEQFCGWVEVLSPEKHWIRETVFNPSGSAHNAERHLAIRAKVVALLEPTFGAITAERVCTYFDSFDTLPLAEFLRTVSMPFEESDSAAGSAAKKLGT